LAVSDLGLPSLFIGLTINVARALEQKRQAMAAHESQLPADAPVFALGQQNSLPYTATNGTCVMAPLVRSTHCPRCDRRCKAIRPCHTDAIDSVLPSKVGNPRTFLHTNWNDRVIYDNLHATVGTEAADYLMKVIPYPPANELATRTDMQAETAMLRGEMGELRGELKTEMSELRLELKTEMSELRSDMSELRGDFRELRTELKTDILTLEARLDTRFELRFSEVRTLTVRLFAVSITANTAAVVSALML